MKIAVATMYDQNYAELAQCVLPNLEAYCHKQDYHLHVEMNPKNLHYTAIRVCQQLLKTYQAVFFMDLDIMVTNHNIQIESFLDDTNTFYLTEDINEINTGTMIVKDCAYLDLILQSEPHFQIAQNYIETTRQYVKVLPHPSINSYPYLTHYAPNYGLIPGWTPRFSLPPKHENGNWQKGDFIYHLPGKPNHDRIRIFEELKKEIV